MYFEKLFLIRKIKCKFGTNDSLIKSNDELNK